MGERGCERTEAHDGPPGGDSGFRSRLIRGDNLPVMQALLPEFRGRVDLVYLDPPFDAGRDFIAEIPVGTAGGRVRVRAYRDRWEPGEYLRMLRERLLLVRELLAETGSLIVHVNWRVSHLVRTLLDEAFGPGERQGRGRPGFRNEIIWGYGGGGATRNAYHRKHDNLYWYTRSDRWTFHPQYRPYTDGTRRRGLTAVKGPRYKLRPEGAGPVSWWTGPEVRKVLSPTAYENLKFPTQKPEALLERIILGHSDPGGLVADFCCGSGTTGVAAERLGRRWLLVDTSPLAIHLCRKRLLNAQQGAWDLYEEWRPEPWGTAAVEARREGDMLEVRLRGIEPSLPSGAILKGAPPCPEAWIDYWGIDPDYDGAVFRPAWEACRLPGRRDLPLEARCTGAGGGRVVIKIVDVLGREILVEPSSP